MDDVGYMYHTCTCMYMHVTVYFVISPTQHTQSDAAKKDMALQSIPQFCFPDVDQWKPVKEYKSESFSFVLTDMEGGRRYGYCRRLLVG